MYAEKKNNNLEKQNFSLNHWRRRSGNKLRKEEFADRTKEDKTSLPNNDSFLIDIQLISLTVPDWHAQLNIFEGVIT